jgi:hypothetical protein
MNSALILYPAIAMFFFTMACIFAMGIARFRAIKNGEVKISFFRTYNEGTQPMRLHLLARHVQNHFEVPPLFYIGVVLVFATQSVSMVTLAFAWLFVFARLVHAYFHLGSNNVNYRFLAFGFGLLMLCGLWLALLFSLVSKAG